MTAEINLSDTLYSGACSIVDSGKRFDTGKDGTYRIGRILNEVGKFSPFSSDLRDVRFRDIQGAKHTEGKGDLSQERHTHTSSKRN